MLLRFFDLTIDIRADDADLLTFIEELWAPFVRRDEPGSADAVIDIERDGAGWAVRVGDDSPLQMFDPWVLALDLRTIIDTLIVDSIPDAVDLHAAMARVGGTTVLFPGDPGAGKTTLLLAGLERGWRLYCDDLSLLDVKTSRIAPMPRPIGIRSGIAISDFESRWRPPAWLAEPTTPYLVPASVFPVSVEDSPVAPDAIVFPRFARGGSTELIPLSSAETLARLGRHVMPLTGETLGALTALSRSVPGSLLTYGFPAIGAETMETGLSAGGR